MFDEDTETLAPEPKKTRILWSHRAPKLANEHFEEEPDHRDERYARATERR